VDAWHYRVLAVVLEGDRTPAWYRTELAKRMQKLTNGLPRGKEHTPAAKYRDRYLRRRAERELTKHLSLEDVAILETAWLLPVNGEAESESDVVQEKDAALCGRPMFPARPDLSEDVTPETNAREVRRFHVDLAKELRRNHKQHSRPRGRSMARRARKAR
jgi:hypothetical protein